MLFISCCLIFVCIYAYLREKEKINQFEFETSNFKHFFVSNIFRDIEYEMSGQIKLLDVDGTEVEWSHIIGKGPKLILFINSLSCEYCISSEIRMMKEYLSDLRTDDIIILTGYSNLNSTNIIAKKYEINYKIYNVVKNAMLPDFMHNPTEPIVFILNENNKIKYLFIPNKNLSFISQEYYNVVKEYFLRQYIIIDNSSQGFEILSVSRDKYKNNWLKAMQTDQMSWKCVWDENSKVTTNMYFVTMFPTNYLINSKGIIIAKNIRGEALEAKLNEIF